MTESSRLLLTLNLCDFLSSLKVKVTQSCPTLCDPTNYTVHGSLQGGTLEYSAEYCSLLQRIFPTQGSNPGFPHCKEDSLPAEPPGKPKNTGVGSLSLLQGIFLTQESNRGLLHCRQILSSLFNEFCPLALPPC